MIFPAASSPRVKSAMTSYMAMSSRLMTDVRMWSAIRSGWTAPDRRSHGFVLVAVHADRPELRSSVDSVRRRLEDPHAGVAGGVKHDVGAGSYIRRAAASAQGRIAEAGEVRELAEILVEHLDVRVDRPRAGLVSGMEWPDEPSSTPPTKPIVPVRDFSAAATPARYELWLSANCMIRHVGAPPTGKAEDVLRSRDTRRDLLHPCTVSAITTRSAPPSDSVTELGCIIVSPVEAGLLRRPGRTPTQPRSKPASVMASISPRPLCRSATCGGSVEEPGPDCVSGRADHEHDDRGERQRAAFWRAARGGALPRCAHRSASRSALRRSRPAAMNSRCRSCDLDRCVVDPGFELGQPRPGQQVVGMPVGRLPLVGGGRERLVALQRAPMAIDPAGQPIPFAEERLVGDLDGRLLRTSTRDRTTAAGVGRTPRARWTARRDRGRALVRSASGSRRRDSVVPTPSWTRCRNTCIATRCSSG